MTSAKTSSSRKLVKTPAQIFEADDPSHVVALAPSILAADFANLSKELRRMMAARCYWAHMDVMDGHFVPNITFGPPMIKCVRGVSPKLFIDTHLMIDDPMKFLGPFAEAGADSVTVHAEAVDNLPRMIAAMRRAKVRVGVSVRPKTSLRAIESVLSQIDLVLVMTVEPGFGGQEMMPNTVNKVRQLANLRERDHLKFTIQVDGGINAQTAGLAVAAGANVLVAGTAVFRGASVKDNVDKLTQAALRMGA